VFTAAQAARLCGGTLVSGDGAREVPDGAKVTIDSREAGPGDLFVALPGTRVDGHAFLTEVAGKGSAAVLISDPRAAQDLGDCAVIAVADTEAGLQKLAAGYRRGFAVPVAAVTGSCGKTTTKELAATILEGQTNALVTPGNRNNQIGLPLTLLALRPEHRACLVELGVNRPGEMDLLTGICAPTLGLITNVGPAHLAGLGSREGVAAEKGRLFAALGAAGTAAVNADDPYVVREARDHIGPKVSYTTGSGPADVAVTAQGDDVVLRIGTETRVLRLFSNAPHQCQNAAAAACLTHLLGCGIEAVAAGLAAFAPRPMRGRTLQTPTGARVIDDTYNANPLSVRAAVEALMATPAAGRRIAVIGDMLELGERAAALHRDTGSAIAALGPDRLVCVGDFADPLREGAARLADVRTSPEPLAAAAHLEDLGPGDVVLVKGSRGLAMERLVALLTNGVEARA
jgi:UDP-N-acetylmuramoyl-tripeptide--D-alanyl-D-alanine ligase